MLEAILDTRELGPEIVLAVELLLRDGEDMTKDQVHQLVIDLLKMPEQDDAEVRVGGIIER
jgi:hypothetical protein